MITKIEKDYGDNYSQLFANATKALKIKYPDHAVYGKDDFQIKSLEDYFVHLSELIQLEEEIGTKDGVSYQIYEGRTYSVLPLQEPIFSINANSRVITIPNDLKNVGVAGDHGAEILYFSIDRYFDNQDLASEDMTTVIEWNNPNSTGEKSGITKAYIAETNIPSYLDSSTNDLKGHKILIGWALGGDVMSAAGTVEFTIRFFQIDNETKAIKYSFSTQPAKITISKTLQYDIFDDIDDSINDLVSNRIKIMESSGTSGLLNPPVFFINVDTYSGNVTDYSNNIEEERYYCDLDAEEIEICVAAKTIDAREPSYTWVYKGIDADIYSPYTGDYGDAFVEVGENTNTEGLVLYTKLADGTYVPAEDLQATGLFYKVNKIKINKPGYYKARASIKTSSASTSAYSYVLVIPGPTTPVIKNTVVDSKENEDKSYISIILAEVVDDQGEGTGEFYANPGVELVKAENYDVSNITSYSWYYNANEENPILPTEGFSLKTGLTTSSVNVSEEGWYKVKAINTRNNSIYLPESNEVNFRITKAPLAPEIIDDIDPQTFMGSLPKFTIDYGANNADKFRVIWYRGNDVEIPNSEAIYTKDEIITLDGNITCPAGIIFEAGSMTYAKIFTIYNNYESEATKTATTAFVSQN